MRGMTELPLFFAPDIASELELPETEAQHCTRVLRMNIGDRIEVTDGKGNLYECEIIGVTKRSCMINILSSSFIPSFWKGNLTIAVGATKHIDRLEWMVEKLVEIGVDRISIIKSDQCERKSTRLDRLERIAVSAMKQSLKTVMPKVETDIPFKDFVASLKDTTSVKMIAHCSDDPTLPKKVTPYELYEGREDAVILIGPEGDFTKEEVEFAIANGFRTITLGEARLRTETAAVSALQWLQIGQKIKLSEENRQK